MINYYSVYTIECLARQLIRNKTCRLLFIEKLNKLKPEYQRDVDKELEDLIKELEKKSEKND